MGRAAWGRRTALVLVGEADTLSPPAEVRAMADALPRGQLVTVGGAGDLAAVKAPEAFTDAVCGFALSACPGA